MTLSRVPRAAIADGTMLNALCKRVVAESELINSFLSFTPLFSNSRFMQLQSKCTLFYMQTIFHFSIPPLHVIHGSAILASCFPVFPFSAIILQDDLLRSVGVDPK